MSDEARHFFDAIASRYDRVYALPSELSRARMRRVLQELPPAPGRVLDLGVGTGRELPALLDAGYAPVGVDFSAAMLERCAKRARPIPLVLADFWDRLPLDDHTFDAAIALHGTLAHPPDDSAPARLGAELARVLKPGAVLIAEVPAPRWLDRVEHAPQTEGRDLRRTGPSTCVFEDRVAGATISARALTEHEWTRALGPAFHTSVDPLGDVEWLVVARRHVVLGCVPCGT